MVSVRGVVFLVGLDWVVWCVLYGLGALGLLHQKICPEHTERCLPGVRRASKIAARAPCCDQASRLGSWPGFAPLRPLSHEWCETLEFIALIPFLLWVCGSEACSIK